MDSIEQHNLNHFQTLRFMNTNEKLWQPQHKSACDSDEQSVDQQRMSIVFLLIKFLWNILSCYWQLCADEPIVIGETTWKNTNKVRNHRKFESIANAFEFIDAKQNVICDCIRQHLSVTVCGCVFSPAQSHFPILLNSNIEITVIYRLVTPYCR